MAAFNSMIHRLTHIPLSAESFQHELNLIKKLALNNGYDPQIIINILNKKEYRMAIDLVFPVTSRTEISQYSSLTFIGKSSQKLNYFLQKYDYKISFRTDNSLAKYIKNDKPKVNKENKSGVYQLSCGSCSSIYIGRTYRNFETRINEHKRSYVNRKSNSNYAVHLFEENHTFDHNFKILRSLG